MNQEGFSEKHISIVRQVLFDKAFYDKFIYQGEGVLISRDYKGLQIRLDNQGWHQLVVHFQEIDDRDKERELNNNLLRQAICELYGDVFHFQRIWIRGAVRSSSQGAAYTHRVPLFDEDLLYTFYREIMFRDEIIDFSSEFTGRAAFNSVKGIVNEKFFETEKQIDFITHRKSKSKLWKQFMVILRAVCIRRLTTRSAVRLLPRELVEHMIRVFCPEFFKRFRMDDFFRAMAQTPLTLNT